MDFEAIARQLAETIEHSGNAKAVFGEPIKLQTQTIVPVAAVLANAGGGGGYTGRLGGGGGGGGGLNLRVIPIGYVHERDGGVVFSAIELPDGIMSLQLPAKPPPNENAGPLVARLLGRLRRT